jgi:hypothetical protein
MQGSQVIGLGVYSPSDQIEPPLRNADRQLGVNLGILKEQDPH